MDEQGEQMSEFGPFCAYNSGNTFAAWKFL